MQHIFCPPVPVPACWCCFCCSLACPPYFISLLSHLMVAVATVVKLNTNWQPTHVQKLLHALSIRCTAAATTSNASAELPAPMMMTVVEGMNNDGKKRRHIHTDRKNYRA